MIHFPKRTVSRDFLGSEGEIHPECTYPLGIEEACRELKMVLYNNYLNDHGHKIRQMSTIYNENI